MEFQVDIKELLEAGAHFGHQTRRWNPKMRDYIYTSRNGIHIIDLEQTVEQAKRAARFISDIVAQGRSVLFVGTKKQARDVIQQEATRVGQFSVSNRWMGGTLTNFKTIKASIDRLNKLYERKEKGEFEKLTKREALQLTRTIQKLENSLGGIKNMTTLPGVVFIIDPNTEDIAKKEALKLHIPIVAMIDTNGNPDGVDYPIVSNDDALRAIQCFTKLIADGCEEGLVRNEARLRELSAKSERDEKRGLTGAAREKQIGGVGRAYTAKKPMEKGEELSEQDIAAFAKAKVEETAA